MLTRKYAVCMHTWIGRRYGTMDVQIENDVIYGLLNLLQHSEMFSGEIDSKGNCTFTGRLITPIRSICYTARGMLTEKALALTLMCGKNTFEVTGSACPAGEEQHL